MDVYVYGQEVTYIGQWQHGLGIRAFIYMYLYIFEFAPDLDKKNT